MVINSPGALTIEIFTPGPSTWHYRTLCRKVIKLYWIAFIALYLNCYCFLRKPEQHNSLLSCSKNSQLCSTVHWWHAHICDKHSLTRWPAQDKKSVQREQLERPTQCESCWRWKSLSGHGEEHRGLRKEMRETLKTEWLRLYDSNKTKQDKVINLFFVLNTELMSWRLSCIH